MNYIEWPKPKGHCVGRVESGMVVVYEKKVYSVMEDDELFQEEEDETSLFNIIDGTFITINDQTLVTVYADAKLILEPEHA